MKFKFFNTIFVIGTSLLISGCSLTNPDYQYNSKSFVSEKKGVVVFKITQDDPGALFGRKDRLLKYGFSNMMTKKAYLSLSRMGVWNGAYHIDYSDCVMMLDPGIYYIHFLELKPSHLLNGSTLAQWYHSGVNKISENEYLFKIGAFEVKSGQVSYLGNLHLESDGKLPFKIINEIDLAKESLQKTGLSNLASKLELQPFYQPGTIFIKNGNNYQFISRESIEKERNQYLDELTEDQ